MAATAVKFITLPPIAKHTATVIFVHGLGDTGYGWKPVADMFQSDPALSHVKWVLPHSFDIYSFGFNTEEDEKGMLSSVGLINQLITAEVASGIDSSRIVLGGFSQGGTMSLLTGLTGKTKLAGVAVLSGWLPMRNKFKSLVSQHATSTPIFWGHGSTDPLVKLQFSQESVEFVTKELGIPRVTGDEFNGLSYHLYEGIGHTTNQRELDELRVWIKKALPA